MARRQAPFGFSRKTPDVTQGTLQLTKNYLHELGSDLESQPIEDEFVIPPRRVPTAVKIKSSVVSTGPKNLQSPAYMATIRRRQARAIANMIAALGEHEKKSDFTVYTYPVFTKIKELLETIQPTREEGNSRMILRLIRDSLMNGQWEKYRNGEIRTKVGALIEKRLIVEEVTMAEVDKTFDELMDLGLNPNLPDLPMPDEINEQEDAQVSG
jgi:hypothetical protein